MLIKGWKHTQQYLKPCKALLLHGLSLPRAQHTCSSDVSLTLGPLTPLPLPFVVVAAAGSPFTAE